MDENKLKSPQMMKAYASIITILISLLISLIVFLFISPSDAFYEFGVLITGGLTYFKLPGFFDILAKLPIIAACRTAARFSSSGSSGAACSKICGVLIASSTE